MAEKLTDSEGREDLVYIKTEDGSYRGWRVDLLIDNLSSKMEEKILLCSSCKGMLRDACFYEGDLKCGVCIPEGVAWQPVKMNREIVSDKMISCPVKKRGCEWSDTVSTVMHHLEKCEFFPVLCPLGCVCLDGERKGKVMKLERKLIPKHQRDSCPLRELVCEFCMNTVKGCEMNPHLEICEHFPLLCPNRCVIEGEEGTRQVKRRDVSVHLANECPLQKVECPYWIYGCREEMERKEMNLHEREFLHIHHRLSITDMKQKQIQMSKDNKLLEEKLDTATERIVLVEKNFESKSRELLTFKQNQIETSKQTIDKLEIATKKIAFLQNENESKIKELSKVKHMEDKLDTANIKIENLEKQISKKDSELKSIIEVLYSHISLATGQLEWKIKGVKQKIENKESSYGDPFYVGLYKCQGNIEWNYDNTGKVVVAICIVKGAYDDKLHWPIIYKYTFILLCHINSYYNYEITKQVTKEDLEKYPNSLKRPTEMRNDGLGTRSLISNTEILEAKYCKEDSITLLIKIELLPAL
ncbi:TNF receptor-associated factor 3 [Oopsacas minuta]|uniref:TNF receptor-associated factor 3 n=1 Tax=Oopsacas minuta TaxID=111878 RepID=A0AAV7KBZ9_9METZ|nr:TNF receptor-associated factor 3 [Oopsacas minuta]